MKIDFYKYQGAGNDFILVDDRAGVFPVSGTSIEAFCHRRFGIGADGLILLRKEKEYDFRMVYFNADGKEGSMCGNGGRCAVRFAHDLGLFEESVRFIAVDGVHEATVAAEIVHLKMGEVSGIAEKEDAFFLNTGSPHYVKFVPDVTEVDVVGEGRAVRYGTEYGPQGGVNVNFVQVIGENRLKVRTYERGVEDETYACGTGVTACALVAYQKMGWTGPVQVDVLGGKLEVRFVPEGTGFNAIWLTGPAAFVYRGDVEV